MTKTVPVLFGTPYALSKFETARYQVVCYDDDNYTQQQAAAMALFGAIPFEGRLPVGSGMIKANDGVETGDLGRLKYSIPEEVGIDPDYLTKIDSTGKSCISVQAAPGFFRVLWQKTER